MTARVQLFLIRRPSFGWLASLFAGGSATAVHATASTVETIGYLPPVPSHMTAWLVAFGAIVSIGVGIITGLAQLANLRALRRIAKAEKAKTIAKAIAEESEE